MLELVLYKYETNEKFKLVFYERKKAIGMINRCRYSKKIAIIDWQLFDSWSNDNYLARLLRLSTKILGGK